MSESKRKAGRKKKGVPAKKRSSSRSSKARPRARTKADAPVAPATESAADEGQDLLRRIRIRAQIDSVLATPGERADQPYAKILSALIYEKLAEEDARELWGEIMGHKMQMESALGRGVRLQVAALDYFSCAGVGIAGTEWAAPPREGEEPAGEKARRTSSRRRRIELIAHQSLDRIVQTALTDGLTGAYSHTHFHQLLQEEVYRARRYDRSLSLLLLDLDDFKDINDTFGHQAGDSALVAVSDILRANIRKSDRLARYGGEEFAIILPEAKRAGAMRIAEKLRTRVEREAAGRCALGRPVTASFGATTLSSESDGAVELVRQADQALYEAKRGGKNRVVYQSCP